MRRDFSVLLLCIVASSASAAGSARCPCGTSSTLPPINAGELAAYDPSLNSATYGIGCAQHDASRQACAPSPPTGLCDGTVQPQPASCTSDDALAWCADSWCYVDPADCDVVNQHSVAMPSSTRYYSYATCGSIDSYSSLMSLQGKVLRVGVQANTGSWHGAYHPTNVAHSRDDQWNGPIWDFVMATAALNGFNINITEPPALVKTATAERGHGGPYWHCSCAHVEGSDLNQSSIPESLP